MERKRLLELAIGGVKEELTHLETELRSISKGIAVGARTFVGRRRAKKRSMSAAARKAASERMKKYWAARRKSRKK